MLMGYDLFFFQRGDFFSRFKHANPIKWFQQIVKLSHWWRKSCFIRWNLFFKNYFCIVKRKSRKEFVLREKKFIKTIFEKDRTPGRSLHLLKHFFFSRPSSLPKIDTFPACEKFKADLLISILTKLIEFLTHSLVVWENIINKPFVNLQNRFYFYFIFFLFN